MTADDMIRNQAMALKHYDRAMAPCNQRVKARLWQPVRTEGETMTEKPRNKKTTFSVAVATHGPWQHPAVLVQQGYHAAQVSSVQIASACADHHVAAQLPYCCIQVNSGMQLLPIFCIRTRCCLPTINCC